MQSFSYDPVAISGYLRHVQSCRPRSATRSLPDRAADDENVIHHGMVVIDTGEGAKKPARLELTRDVLAIQVPVDLSESVDSATDMGAGLRSVTLRRQLDGGLGVSIKGGADATCDMPILISKVFKEQAAEASGELFIGDAIVEVNGAPTAGLGHDAVVALMRDAGDNVCLSVRHCAQMVPYLTPGDSLRKQRSASTLSDSTAGAAWKSCLKHPSDLDRGSASSTTDSSDDAPEGWRTLVKLQLPMAYITRYLWGTDKLRTNAFEVRAIDGTSSGVVHCEDGRALDQWVRHVQANITQLNNKSIRISNKFLHHAEQIVFLGWICERERDGVEGDLTHKWEPRFLILKGSDVCFFQSPPLNAEELNRCVFGYKIYETVFREAKEDKLDRRDECVWVETAAGEKHYLSVESPQQLTQLEAAWNRATYHAMSRLQSKTFACNFDGRPSALTLDLRSGFALYDIPTKRHTWHYKFSDLKSSSDDGKMRLQLIFRNQTTASGQEVKNLDCAELYPLVYCLYAFYLTRIISLDPDFLKAN